MTAMRRHLLKRAFFCLWRKSSCMDSRCLACLLTRFSCMAFASPRLYAGFYSLRLQGLCQGNLVIFIGSVRQDFAELITETEGLTMMRSGSTIDDHPRFP